MASLKLTSWITAQVLAKPSSPAPAEHNKTSHFCQLTHPVTHITHMHTHTQTHMRDALGFFPHRSPYTGFFSVNWLRCSKYSPVQGWGREREGWGWQSIGWADIQTLARTLPSLRSHNSTSGAEMLTPVCLPAAGVAGIALFPFSSPNLNLYLSLLPSSSSSLYLSFFLFQTGSSQRNKVVKLGDADIACVWERIHQDLRLWHEAS